MWVLIEQEVIMRRGSRALVRTLEEEPSGKVKRAHYLLNTMSGERRPVSASAGKAEIETVNQGRLF